MGEVIIAIRVKDRRVKSKLKNIGADADDIAKSIAVLEVFKAGQVEMFQRFNEEE